MTNFVNLYSLFWVVFLFPLHCPPIDLVKHYWSAIAAANSKGLQPIKMEYDKEWSTIEYK